MKNKKLQTGSQWLIVAIVAILLATCAIVGMLQIKAEPTIHDLVQTPEIGTFKPSELYVDGKSNLKPVAFLDTTNIFISYDMWIDTSGDGQIDVEDVYSVEGFETKMYAGQNTYTIYDIGETSNAYIIYFDDYASFEAVLVKLQVANNNDQAEMKDISTYYFDSKNNILYIDKSMIDTAVTEDNYTVIRSESIFLYKDDESFTKKVPVMTGFDKEIEDLHNLDQLAVNDYMYFQVKGWLTHGYVSYRIVPVDYLAYISSDNLDVYIDGLLMDKSTWSYDETTGYIQVGCEPYSMKEILVRVHALNEVDEQQLQIQALQAKNDNKTAQAAEYSDVLTKNNPFLKKLYYETAEPEIGTTDGLGFTCWTRINIRNASNPYYNNEDAQPFFTAKNAKESVSRDYLREAVDASIKVSDVANGHYQSATLSVFRGAENVTTTLQNGSTLPTVYAPSIAGQVIVNMHAFDESGDMKYLNNANDIVKNEMLTRVSSDLYTGKNDNILTTSWKNGDSYYDARYLSGTHHTDFLKSTKKEGYVLFDGICGRIEEPSAVSGMDYNEWRKWRDEMLERHREDGGTGSAINSVHGTSCDYHAYATIVDKTETDLYIMFWSKTVMSNDYSGHSQRVLGFSRVEYVYNGKGTVNFSKLNDNHDFVDGAHYSIYKKGDSTNPVKTLETTTNVVTFELAAGTYYYVETAAPVGYLLNSDPVEFTVISGQAIEVIAQDEKQMCDVTFTVYDQTTEWYQTKAPVEGIEFQLIDVDTGAVYPNISRDQLTTDVHGRISFTVPTNGAGYTLKQHNTVKDYCLYENHTVVGEERYNCSSIPVAAIANRDGVNLSINLVHYEHRQTIDIKSQVQDAALGASTPAILGGTGGGYVETINSAYKLKAEEDLFLGYLDNGQNTKVIAPAGTTLEILTAISSDTSVAKAYSSTAVSHSDDGNKSFIVATRIRYNGNIYPVPNGLYSWELISTSDGYYNDKLITDIDASWTAANMTKKHISVVQYPVVQTRQRASVEVFVKSYDQLLDYNVAGATEPNIKAIGLVASNKEISYRLQNNLWTSTWLDHVKSGEWLKHMHTSAGDGVITKDTTESINIFFEGNPSAKMSLNTKSPVGGVAVKIVTTCDIVDIATGLVIPANTELDVQVSNSDGLIVFNSYEATKEIDDPNIEGHKLYIPTVMAKSGNGKVAVSGQLPTGTYKVVTVSYKSLIDDDTGYYVAEYGMENDLINDTHWTNETQTAETINIQTIAGLKYIPEKPVLKMEIEAIVAPDVPVDPDDPYDPNNPDDLTDDPDDSTDITRIEDLFVNEEKDIYDDDDITFIIGEKVNNWIKQRKLDVAYRIIDLTNVVKDDQGNTTEYDVSDKLPTTMAFTYINNTVIDPEIYDYRYTMKFYYEITKQEYDEAPDALKVDGQYKAVDVDNDNDIDYYVRRFSDHGISGGDYLQDIITINEHSTGFINYQELKRTYLDVKNHNENKYTTISAAISDYEWINKKMQDEINRDGTYHILIEFGMECVRTSVIDGSKQPINYDDSLVYGVLTIKNRELFELD